MTTTINLESYPLTPLQQGMLYHTLSEPNSGVEIEQILCRIREPLEVPAFQCAWTRVVRRHPILRTRFQWEGVSEPRQLVEPDVDLPWKSHDWRHQSSTESKKRLEKFLLADRRCDFEMTEPPLMRLNLFELSDTDYHCLWTFHHALLDGRSFPLVINEVFRYYEAFIENRDVAIEEPRPYRDYVQWLQQQDLSRAEKFWRQHLKGFSAPTPLTVAHSVDENGEKGRDAEEIRLSDKLTTKLNSLAGDHELTLNTLIQGAWALLLHHYSGENDIVFGATRACRHSTVDGAESMIGLLINTLPVRVSISPDQPLLDWLKQIREQQLALRPYENTALFDVQRWSDVLSQAPLFESIVVFDDASLSARLRAQGGRWLKREFIYRGQTNYALTLIGYGDSQLLLRIEYDRQRFDRPSARRMLGHVYTLLEGMAANPNVPATRVPYVTSAERQQLLVEWNNTQAEYPEGACLHQLFEAQVERIPDAVAVVFEDERLTYRELNTRANQLAHHLQALGVRPEVLVGIFMERSLEMVIGLYGILKAGGAYVPLDPGYPQERLAFMLEDAQVPMLLTQEPLVKGLPEHEAHVLCLDADWPEIARASEENPASGAAAGNLAYMIFTSGSTGRPKGAMNTHRAICNRLFWMQDEYQLTEADRVLQKTPFSFDVSVWEFFWPLLTGARLVVARPEGHKDSTYLARLIVDQGVTTLHFVPSMLQIFLEDPAVEACKCLRRVICSGEALPFDLQDRFFGRLSAELHNLYGPTEAAIDVTFWECKPQYRHRIVPIGRPVANTQMYILDPHLRPVPVGIPAELHIGGVQVGRGYFNRPELTAEKFISDPFSNDPNACLYKTGDLARYLPDGNIEYLGRLDDQIKIRGFRIELGEIQAVLGQHPAVRETVVADREDVPGDKRLVAYLISEQPAPTTSELCSFLKEKLPDYMVPSAFVFLEALPLTANGKIDRHALPPPSQERSTEHAYVAPRDQAERTIARIWREVLNVNKVGIHDGFFELGGHSLLLVKVLGKLQASFDRALSVVELFRYPTVAKLATYLTENENEEKKASFATTHDLVRKERIALSQYKKVTLTQRKST